MNFNIINYNIDYETIKSSFLIKFNDKEYILKLPLNPLIFIELLKLN